MDVFGMLTVIFTVAKLMGAIDWSWLWVLSPTLIPLGVMLLAAIVASILEESEES